MILARKTMSQQEPPPHFQFHGQAGVNNGINYKIPPEPTQSLIIQNQQPPHVGQAQHYHCSIPVAVTGPVVCSSDKSSPQGLILSRFPAIRPPTTSCNHVCLSPPEMQQMLAISEYQLKTISNLQVKLAYQKGITRDLIESNKKLENDLKTAQNTLLQVQLNKESMADKQAEHLSCVNRELLEKVKKLEKAVQEREAQLTVANISAFYAFLEFQKDEKKLGETQREIEEVTAESRKLKKNLDEAFDLCISAEEEHSGSARQLREKDALIQFLVASKNARDAEKLETQINMTIQEAETKRAQDNDRKSFMDRLNGFCEEIAKFRKLEDPQSRPTSCASGSFPPENPANSQGRQSSIEEMEESDQEGDLIIDEAECVVSDSYI